MAVAEVVRQPVEDAASNFIHESVNVSITVALGEEETVTTANSVSPTGLPVVVSVI